MTDRVLRCPTCAGVAYLKCERCGDEWYTRTQSLASSADAKLHGAPQATVDILRRAAKVLLEYAQMAMESYEHPNSPIEEQPTEWQEAAQHALLADQLSTIAETFGAGTGPQ